MNYKTKLHTIYIFLVCMLVFMLGASWVKYQKENSLIVVHADTIPDYPVLDYRSTPTPTPSMGWAFDKAEGRSG